MQPFRVSGGCGSILPIQLLTIQTYANYFAGFETS